MWLRRWYFDAHLDDGATVVVVFYAKPNVSPNGPIARVTINLTLPDGRSIVKLLDAKPELFKASKLSGSERTASLAISTLPYHGNHRGDIGRHRIDGRRPRLASQVRSSLFRHRRREKLFAWLPSVPHGQANVRYTIGHKEHRASGSGYHDHNWGDVPMQTVMHNWGAGQRRTLYGHSILHHSHRSPWV